MQERVPILIHAPAGSGPDGSSNSHSAVTHRSSHTPCAITSAIRTASCFTPSLSAAASSDPLPPAPTTIAAKPYFLATLQHEGEPTPVSVACRILDTGGVNAGIPLTGAATTRSMDTLGTSVALGKSTQTHCSGRNAVAKGPPCEERCPKTGWRIDQFQILSPVTVALLS